MAKAIHAMIRVLDLDRSLAFYEEAFGLGVNEQLDFDDFTLAYLCNDENDFEIELTLNKGREEPYTHGDGYGHIAVCVDDAGSERERLSERGFNPTEVKDFHRDGGLLARFFFVTDPDGYKIEVLERVGRFK
jgi:lactoylglutathione lyase